MRFKGRFKSATRDYQSDRINITFELLEGHINELDELIDKDLSVEAKKFYDKRSGKANRLLWGCIGDISQSLNQDKWEIYLHYIRRQGQFTTMQIIPEALEKLQSQWRETEVIGTAIVNGIEMLDVICYFGSSTYNSKEFGLLLDDIIEDMKAMGIPLPTSEEMQIAIDELERGNREK